MIHAVFGLILLASSSVLLYFLDGQRTTVARAEQLAYLPKGEYLKLAVLGYRHVVADLIWLQAVQHIGAKRDTQLGISVDLPCGGCADGPGSHLRPPYQATGILPWCPRRSSRGRPRHFAQRHSKQSEIWQLPFLAGYISYYELCNPVAGAGNISGLRLSSRRSGYLPKLAARMTVESGDPTAALEFLDRFSRSVHRRTGA